MGSSHVMELTELSLSETVDEQEIENLLNEYSESEYECQNDNELWTLLNSCELWTVNCAIPVMLWSWTHLLIDIVFSFSTNCELFWTLKLAKSTNFVVLYLSLYV